MIYLFTLDDSLTSLRFTTRTEELTKCYEPLQKLRVRLYDFVPIRVSFGCSLGPLHFICSVQASTVTTSLQQLLTLLLVVHVVRWYLYFGVRPSVHIFKDLL